MGRRCGFLGLVTAAALACGAAAGGEPVAAHPTGTVDVEVRGLRNARGLLRAKLVAAPDGFPGSDAHVLAKQKSPISAERARLRFRDVPYGVYALVVLHDEDGDGALARGWLGLPAEGLAFSSGARVQRGPPSFEEARFTLDRPRVELRLELAY
jgi:uncharacterized protein (DUF2141 family)